MSQGTAQYSIINLIGKGFEKEQVCMYLTESLCCTTGANTTLLINYTLK